MSRKTMSNPMKVGWVHCCNIYFIHLLSPQLTPASSLWSQSFSPHPLKEQLAIVFSDPRHSTSSIQIGPRPVPIPFNAVPPLSLYHTKGNIYIIFYTKYCNLKVILLAYLNITYAIRFFLLLTYTDYM